MKSVLIALVLLILGGLFAPVLAADLTLREILGGSVPVYEGECYVPQYGHFGQCEAVDKPPTHFLILFDKNGEPTTVLVLMGNGETETVWLKGQQI